MSCSELWDRECVHPKDLPTLQQVLRDCDARLLVRVVLEGCALRDASRAPSAKQRAAAERRLADALACMRRLSVKRKRGRDRVFLPLETYELQGCSGLLLRSVRAVHLPLACPGPSFSIPRRLPSYAAEPWEDVLASRVWLGGPWCRRERYDVLADAFWEMTTLGFEYREVRARQREGRLAAPSRIAGPPDYGLTGIPDFDLAYRQRLEAWRDELNARARAECLLRLADVVERLGGASGGGVARSPGRAA